MELRIKPSEPGYPEVNAMAEYIARLKNTQVWCNLRDMPEIERLVAICDFEDALDMKMHEIQMGRLMR